MNWYLQSFRLTDEDWKNSSRTEDLWPALPTFEQRMTLIQGLEIWLSDPTGAQNLTEETYDEWCEMMRSGLA